MTAERIQALEEALREMCEEFRGHDLPYGSKAYQKAIAALVASQPAPTRQQDLTAAFAEAVIERGFRGFSTSMFGTNTAPTFTSGRASDTAPVGQPLTVQDAARVPEIAALIEKSMNREPSLIWIIENTSQVRIRDLALDILTQQRDALRAIAEGRA